MKRILCLLLICMLLLPLSIACDTDSEGAKPGETTAASTTGTETTKADSPSLDNPSDSPTPETPTPDMPPQTVDIKAALATLLSHYRWNPKSAIPNAMLPEYQANWLSDSSVPQNYSQNVSVSNIPHNGHGEQWNMVMENVEQSQMFFTVLSVVDNLTTVSITAFNNYFDQNPANTAHYTFQEGIYSVTIDCDADDIYYVLEYTATIPSLGEQRVQIALSMDLDTMEKRVRVQFGDAYALAYTVNQNTYSFALKYLGVRTAYFELSEGSGGSTVGHIYEYLSVQGHDVVKSVADFYITNSYVTVVGNKAGGLVGFDGYICELYSATTGKMQGYEVRESLTVSGAGVTYNTLWFDMAQISGIGSLKCADEAWYVNGSNTPWETKNYGLSGGLKVASRRFDIELRTQYFYYYDSVNQKVEKIAVEVPMLFVQEEVYADLVSDVRGKNGITIGVDLGSVQLSMLMSEYDTKVDVLVTNLNKYTSDNIIAYIGSSVTFTA